MKARPGAVGYVGVINLFKKLWLWLMCLCLMIGQAGLAESMVDEAVLNPAPQVEALAPYWLELDKAVGEGRKASVQVTADCPELPFMGEKPIAAQGLPGYEIHMGHTEFTGEVRHPFHIVSKK